MENPQQRNLSSAFDSFSFERRHASPTNQPSYQPRRSPNLSNSNNTRNYEVSASEVPVENEVEAAAEEAAEAETSDPEQEAPASPRQRRKSITFDSSVKTFGGRQQTTIPRLGATKASSSLSINPFDGYSNNYSFERRGSTSSRRGSGFLTAAQKLLLTPALSESACSLTSASTACSEASDETSEVGNSGASNDRNDREPRTKAENSYLMTRLPSGERHSPELYIPHVSARHGSFSSTRSRRRTISERSINTGSFSCSSPASVFLSSFCAPVAPVPEPDAEGQEVGSYILGRQLGSGGFSVVKEAVTMEDNLEVSRAVKIVKKRVSSPGSPGDSEEEIDRIQAEFDQEVAMWRYLTHPNIMQLIAVIDTPEATYAFMPLCRDGNLFELLRQPANREGLSHQRVTRYAAQLASALRYLHEDMRIVHGDVKLENCMLDLANNKDEGGNILLNDFGLAKYISSSDSSDSDSAEDHHPAVVSTRKSQHQNHQNNESFFLTGSLPYSAPELLSSSSSSSSSHITPASDIYAFAITIFTLYTGTLPFSHELPPKLAAMIEEGKWDSERLTNCRGLKNEARETTESVLEALTKALGKDPRMRGSMAELLGGNWLRGCGLE
ncbi:kinase-like domain-containing protein [Pyronema omphalodes]|nr:kinase-like domain-containing protein [Pyronema omphalodes]